MGTATARVAIAPPLRRGRSARRWRLALAPPIVLLGLIVLAAIVGPPLWGHDPLAQQVTSRFRPPSFAHPLGTDQFGRDVLARLLSGARWSLAGAALVCAGTSLLGFLIGALAASGNRAIDLISGRLIESLMALPGIVTALALTAILGPSFRNLLFAMIITNWPTYARLYRALLLRERGAPYVEAAFSLGATRARLLVRHIIPNVLGPALVLATANFGSVILSLAGLSFLGLGMQQPTPEWGMMINNARPYFQRYPWQIIAPGLCVAVTVLAINLTGDALRDALDPRTNQTRR